MALYIIHNFAVPTTTQPAGVAVTTLKTLLQVKPLTGIDLKLKEWGYHVQNSAATTPGIVELIETDVAATVTASVTGDITRLDNPAGPAADTGLISLGTAATGYTATAEGTITAVRYLDGAKLLPPTGPYEKQIVLGAEAKIQAGKFGRIRASSGTSVPVLCYIIFEG